MAAFQEQSTTINSLTQKLSDLEAMIADCCERSLGMRESNSNVPSDFNSQSVELRNLNETYLGQNIPNPYSNQTTIPYFVPNEIGKAQIIFFDRLGRIISKIDLLGRGAGQLTVLAMDLSDGVYSYSLLSDDKLVDTKIMVRQH